MIEYIVGENPDDRILMKASGILKMGGLVSFPTDTNWIVACDPFSRDGVEKLYKLKGEEKGHHFSLLYSDISQASEVANISDNAFKYMKRRIPGHYTFILPASKSIMKALKASKTDHEVGLRFPPSLLCEQLFKAHGSGLLSTNLTYDMLGVSEEEPVYGLMVDENINAIDMVLDPGEVEFAGESTIIGFTLGVMDVIREGAGEI